MFTTFAIGVEVVQPVVIMANQVHNDAVVSEACNLEENGTHYPLEWLGLAMLQANNQVEPH